MTYALRDLDAGVEIHLLNPHPHSSLAWYKDFPTYDLTLKWVPSASWSPAVFAPITLARAIRRLDLDILHAPGNVAPFIGPRLGVRRVATIHDVAPLLLPREHRAIARVATRIAVPPLRWTADAVLTDSHAAAADLVRRAHLPREKIRVTPLGVAVPTDDQLESWQSSPPAIPGLEAGVPYVLAVGDIRPRKNLKRVVDAFQLVAPAHPELKLVIAGQAMHKAPEILALGDTARGSVVLAGYVDEPTLHRLYANGRALIMPSLYEGFGLPALEAMAHGLPVVISDSPALIEVAGDDGVIVDPYSVESIAGGIRTTLDEPERAVLTAERGRVRAAGFTWRNTALKTLEAYESLGIG